MQVCVLEDKLSRMSTYTSYETLAKKTESIYELLTSYHVL